MRVAAPLAQSITMRRPQRSRDAGNVLRRKSE